MAKNPGKKTVTVKNKVTKKVANGGYVVTENGQERMLYPSTLKGTLKISDIRNAVKVVAAARRQSESK